MHEYDGKSCDGIFCIILMLIFIEYDGGVYNGIFCLNMMLDCHDGI